MNTHEIYLLHFRLHPQLSFTQIHELYVFIYSLFSFSFSIKQLFDICLNIIVQLVKLGGNLNDVSQPFH